MSERSPVAVYGAGGHTGRFVVAELRRRGWPVVASGRDTPRLRALEADGVVVRPASLGDEARLEAALRGSRVIINCAGPFLDTADTVIHAALRIRAHYLDVTAEQAAARHALAHFAEPAARARVAVVPAAGFFGALGELLARAALGDWADADEVEIAIALDSWHPTEGTRATGRRNTVPRQVISDGHLAPLQLPPRTRSWHFGGAFGEQQLVELPFSETVLIAHHLRVRQQRTWLTAKPLADLRDPSTPAPQPVTPDGRSAQQFRMECVVRRGQEERHAAASGTDIYAVSAPLVVALAEHVVSGSSAGALTPAQVVEASTLLSALGDSGMSFEGPTVRLQI
jgi:short subunit dehydrogenase-like uncharacterized protein